MDADKFCNIEQKGNIVLENGKLVGYDKDPKTGERRKRFEMVVGIDGLYIDGCEPIICQKNDPPQIRLASRFDDGLGGGGVVNFCRLRSDDRMENMAHINGGNLDYPQGDDRGQIRLMVRTTSDQHSMQTAFVATTYALNSLWTGAANWLGWLWKLNNPGDQPPVYVSNANVIARMWSPDGLYFTQQQEDGNFATYRTTVPFSLAGEHVTAIWSAWTGKIPPPEAPE